MTLCDVAVGEHVVLESCDLAPEHAAWISAIGLAAGESLQVLQRAPAGGPIHVRLEGGVELAVARDVARALVVVKRP